MYFILITDTALKDSKMLNSTSRKPLLKITLFYHLTNNINTYVPVLKIISVYRCIIGSQFNMN